MHVLDECVRMMCGESHELTWLIGEGDYIDRWVPTVAALGMRGLHFHDLRHSGNVWAAQTKVSTKDLMSRMGHDDIRAALIYQRATSEADRHIADQLGALVDRHHDDEEEGEDDDDGAAGALVPAS